MGWTSADVARAARRCGPRVVPRSANTAGVWWSSNAPSRRKGLSVDHPRAPVDQGGEHCADELCSLPDSAGTGPSACRGTGVGPCDGPGIAGDPQLPPDRLLHGKPILDAMAEGGVYHSQFVTGTSNGGLTAHPGGDRWRWESQIFDGAYDEATAHERPVYGALNFRRKPVGGAPRFGSAHFRLTARTLSARAGPAAMPCGGAGPGPLLPEHDGRGRGSASRLPGGVAPRLPTQG